MTDGLADIVAEHLDVLFCGINPGLEAAATGHHFAGRGNRFWRVLHLAGFTPDEITPEHSHDLLHHRCGLTAVVARATARADELQPQDFRDAAPVFERKLRLYRPRFVAFLGKPAYAALIGRRDIAWGLQATPIAGTSAWILPNPSGRNLAFSLDRLVEAYRELRIAAFGGSGLS